MILNHNDDGEGHVIVLLHGMFGSHTNLNNIARFLSSNYRVLNCDLRNQGDSFHNDTMDLTSMANDVVRLLDKLDIKQASILGHSLGGKVAMQFALMFPNRCSKLIIADISPVAYAPRHDVVLDSLLNLSDLDIESRSQADNFLKKTIDNEVMRAFLLKNLSRVDGGKYKIKINMKAIKENYYTNLEKTKTTTNDIKAIFTNLNGEYLSCEIKNYNCKGIFLNKIFMSSTESIATPALPTSPLTKTLSESYPL